MLGLLAGLDWTATSQRNPRRSIVSSTPPRLVLHAGLAHTTMKRLVGLPRRRDGSVEPWDAGGAAQDALSDERPALLLRLTPPERPARQYRRLPAQGRSQSTAMLAARVPPGRQRQLVPLRPCLSPLSPRDAKSPSPARPRLAAGQIPRPNAIRSIGPVICWARRPRSVVQRSWHFSQRLRLTLSSRKKRVRPFFQTDLAKQQTHPLFLLPFTLARRQTRLLDVLLLAPSRDRLDLLTIRIASSAAQASLSSALDDKQSQSGPSRRSRQTPCVLLLLERSNASTRGALR